MAIEKVAYTAKMPSAARQQIVDGGGEARPAQGSNHKPILCQEAYS